MKLSIIVINYDTAEDLACCLRSLRAHRPAVEHEVIVVDNHSPDQSALRVRREFPECRLIVMPENRGFGHAANAGARRAAGEFLLFLNADILATPGAIDALVARLEEDASIGILGARLTQENGAPQVSWGRYPSFGHEAVRKMLHSAWLRRLGLAGPLMRWLLPKGECAWVSGACLVGRRPCLFSDGRRVFDERFFMYFEDIDLCLRARSDGWKVVHAPEVVFIHAGGVSAARHPARAMRAYRESQLKFYRKHFSDRAVRMLSAYLRLKLRAQMLRCRLAGEWQRAQGGDGVPQRRRLQALRQVMGLCRVVSIQRTAGEVSHEMRA